MKVDNTEDYNAITSVHRSVKNIDLPKKVKRKKEDHEKKEHEKSKDDHLPSDEERYVDRYV